jgi:hypothetical protein
MRESTRGGIGALVAAVVLSCAGEARAGDGAGDRIPVRSSQNLRLDVVPAAPPRGPLACEVPCGWRFEATIPVWIPSITGTFASGDATIDADNEPAGVGDFFDKFIDSATELQLAFMGRFTARRGPWTLALDGLYASIGETIDWRIRDEDTEGDLGAAIARAYAAWQTRLPLGCDPCSPCLAVGPLVGARIFYADLEVDGASGEDVDRTKSWVDAIVGVRADLLFAGGTTFTLLADVGGSPSGSELSWSVGLEVAVPLSRRWSLLFGWTLLDVDCDLGGGSNGFEMNVRLSGPSLGITYRF